ncbi:MAG: hypothetical protein AAGH64_06295 [Planctomycetota bacterium]
MNASGRIDAGRTDAWRTWDAPSRSEDRRSRLDRSVGAVVRACTPDRSSAPKRAADRALEGEAVDARVSDGDLLARAGACAHTFALGRDTTADLVEALRVIRQLARRTLGLRMHPVQLEAGATLASGRLVELATGEGKTLVACVPAIVHAWRARGCHVLTTNDYLAERDRALNAPLFDALRITSACVTTRSTRDERRAAYRADVTYTTAREACADHLRDRLDARGARSLAGAIASASCGSRREEPVQRGLASAVVDEADGLLIDDAITPLVLSAQGDADAGRELHALARAAACGLKVGGHFALDRRSQDVTLTARGFAEAVRDRSWPVGANRAHELVVTALRAEHLFERGRAYIVADGRVVIVDPATGRPTPERTWRDGLHEAIEAKEGLEHAPRSQTLASLSFQRFFRRYERLCGMSGTLASCARETHDVYGLPMTRLEPHRPVLRTRERDRLFVRSDDAHRAIAVQVRACVDAGRPVLVGVRSVETSERVSSVLRAVGVGHNLLNASRPAREAEVVARAGAGGRVTVATGMAGRGTDIRLDAAARAAGGLHVIVAELHDSTRAEPPSRWRPPHCPAPLWSSRS